MVTAVHVATLAAVTSNNAGIGARQRRRCETLMEKFVHPELATAPEKLEYASCVQRFVSLPSKQEEFKGVDNPLLLVLCIAAGAVGLVALICRLDR